MDAAPAAGPPARSHPWGGRPLHVDPDSLACRALAAGGPDADAIAVLARTPQARWLGDWLPTATVEREVAAHVGAAAAQDALPVLVLYAIPLRDRAGGLSAGGLGSPSAYLAWLDAALRGIGDRPAVVVVEPDALAGLDALPAGRRRERLALLREASARLAGAAGVVGYLDAGHSGWLAAETAAERLAQAGVERLRGFSLNVSGFGRTADELAYGESVAARLGGAHYVVDTSRNGLGPPPAGPLSWCNPPGRALGPSPTTRAGAPHADGLLWVKRPGESDGDARPGEPPAGAWFPAQAVDLVRRRKTHTRGQPPADPPRGDRSPTPSSGTSAS